MAWRASANCRLSMNVIKNDSQYDRKNYKSLSPARKNLLSLSTIISLKINTDE